METSTSSEIPQVIETMDAIEGTYAMNEAWARLNQAVMAAEDAAGLAIFEGTVSPEPDVSSHIDPMVRLVLRVPKDNCQHTDKKEVRKNRFECDDCGSSWRFVRKSAIRRRMMLR
jgi:hypothetical protein